jgi:hypothetical protein
VGCYDFALFDFFQLFTWKCIFRMSKMTVMWIFFFFTTLQNNFLRWIYLQFVFYVIVWFNWVVWGYLVAGKAFVVLACLGGFTFVEILWRATLRMKVGGAMRVFESSQALEDGFKFWFFGEGVGLFERIAASFKKHLPWVGEVLARECARKVKWGRWKVLWIHGCYEVGWGVWS